MHSSSIDIYMFRISPMNCTSYSHYFSQRLLDREIFLKLFENCENYFWDQHILFVTHVLLIDIIFAEGPGITEELECDKAKLDSKEEIKSISNDETKGKWYSKECFRSHLQTWNNNYTSSGFLKQISTKFIEAPNLTDELMTWSSTDKGENISYEADSNTITHTGENNEEYSLIRASRSIPSTSK